MDIDRARHPEASEVEDRALAAEISFLRRVLKFRAAMTSTGSPGSWQSWQTLPDLRDMVYSGDAGPVFVALDLEQNDPLNG